MTIKDLREDVFNVWVELNKRAEKFNILIDLKEVGGAFVKVTASINGKNETTIACGITDEGELLNLLLSYNLFLYLMEEKDSTMENTTDGFEEVEGDTHGMPALISSLTDETVFFRDNNGILTNVDDVKEGIDYFAGKEGRFVVMKGRKAIAEWKVRVHDNYGIEW